MKRRTFIQRILGVVGIGVVGLSKDNGKELEKPPKGSSMAGFKTKEGCRFFDFSPEKVVAITEFRGRCIVACEHSIWEIEEDCYGEFLQRKLINYI
ncbi:MAG: hypothetical protein MUO31_13055 [Thermodesulfovibrionales bacterium]|nr:hypothetical protein [Thermodesulfovibrionales bacterium]